MTNDNFRPRRVVSLRVGEKIGKHTPPRASNSNSCLVIYISGCASQNTTGET
ncbi:hypothetical protein [[Phormidium] sp. ETS-05]|uniref:hypothetical protein n=1 Tax=[Phormidium] sp. ETS-05 TaxID=222819 RepID=UPI0018EF14E9|nr:hypothetical protein [[Phormidium] sp. ETS-05]